MDESACRRYIEIVASVAIERCYPEPADRAGQLYEAHADWLLRYCRRHLVDRADAEDAVQTTFLYAFRALRRGVVPECERAWLTTIARNVCHAQRRATGRRPEDPATPDVDHIALARPETDEAGFIDDVRAALAALPEKQRRALVLREWQGVPSHEIAATLRLSEQATHALLSRARRSFAKTLSASRRPLAGINVAVLCEQLGASLKPLFGGAAVKAAIAATAASVVVGGVVVEQRWGDDAPRPVRPALPAAVDSSRDPASETDRRATPRTVTSRSRPLAVPAAVASMPSEESGVRAAQPTKTTSEVPVALPEAPAPVPEVPRQAPPPEPQPAPPAEPPVTTPIDPPPILGEEPPIVLPPVEEILPPVEELPLPSEPSLPALPPLP